MNTKVNCPNCGEEHKIPKIVSRISKLKSAQTMTMTCGKCGTETVYPLMNKDK